MNISEEFQLAKQGTGSARHAPLGVLDQDDSLDELAAPLDPALRWWRLVPAEEDVVELGGLDREDVALVWCDPTAARQGDQHATHRYRLEAQRTGLHRSGYS